MKNRIVVIAVQPAIGEKVMLNSSMKDLFPHLKYPGK
jgi:hypothetical protein